MRHLLLIALLSLALSGCGAGWHRVDAPPATMIPPRQQVLVYHGSAVERWHATTMISDSIVGIPWLTPIECDTCRVSLPLATVDSIRVGDPAKGFWRSYAFGAYVALPVTALLLCAYFGGCSFGD